MYVNDVHYRSIWLENDGWQVAIIDQRRLPFEFIIQKLNTLEAAADAIRGMAVRGAPLIGATAAYGMALAMQKDSSDDMLSWAFEQLLNTRPTAINLRWSLLEMLTILEPLEKKARAMAAYAKAAEICDEDVSINHRIGCHGLALIESAAKCKNGEPVNILTHCNAGWLATVDWGTATAPIYMAHDKGIPVHVWIDETRPRNQGASLTAWELGQHGVPHTVIADNVGGHLMQVDMVDLCITGTDCTTAEGDVANKIGTYLKALAAQDNNVPFYVALPSPTIDWTACSGLSSIPIEERDGMEVSHITGRDDKGEIKTVQITPDNCDVANYAFDITPGRLVSGLITERGVADASRAGLESLFGTEH